MSTATTPDNPNKALQIKQDDKFFTRLMSKESSLANPSFRVYYGGASGAVPFMWESQPGTPKHKFHDTSLPPLTPPPSSYHSSKFNYSHNNKKPTTNNKYSSPNPIIAIFPKFAKRRQLLSALPPPSPSPSPSPSSSSSSRSASSFHRRMSSSVSSLDSRGYDMQDEVVIGSSSPTSTLCFGPRRGKSCNEGQFRGCYSSFVVMKSALSSIVGHGSA
ncbi:hypothetical protein Scep_005824 [Stephania cephalantha]|uniref:Uncharacterized protein n=1 Tax=Stephania cephalantha TaxID=152367 RepID=A0AAP0PXV4_9MAGN